MEMTTETPTSATLERRMIALAADRIEAADGPVDIGAASDAVMADLTPAELALAARLYVFEFLQSRRRAFVKDHERRTLRGEPDPEDEATREQRMQARSERVQRARSMGMTTKEMDQRDDLEREASTMGVDVDTLAGMSEFERATMRINAILDREFWRRFDEILPLEFATGDGRRVTWGEATIEDHESRVRMQAQLAGSVIEDIQLHEIAIRVLRERGAMCLNEVST